MRLSFDAIASQFDYQRGLPREALTAWMNLVDDLAKAKSLQVVEPGIGTGRIALPLAAIGHCITGTDISQPMLDACQTSATALNLNDRLDLQPAEASHLPFADHTFDLGVVAQLLYLIPDWPTVLDELARVVKPCGHVIHLTEPTEESAALSSWSATWRQMIEATGYRHIELSPSDDDVHAEFLRRWPDVHVRKLASWSFGQTVAEAMTGYAERLRPLYTEVPEDDFNRVVDEFLLWARKSYPNGETRLEGTVNFTALIAAA